MRMRQVGHVAHIGGIRNAYKVLVGTDERDHFGDIGVDGRVILNWNGKKDVGRLWTVFI
jgi:hypothetical protein